MKAVKFYPFMLEFVAGSLSANSGGELDPFTEIHGTEEEWESAERQLKYLCNDNLMAAYHMGQLSDEGVTTLWQVPDVADFHTEYGQSGPEFRLPGGDVDYVVAMPYIILEKYYY